MSERMVEMAWARRPFEYDGAVVDRGQVFKLHGCVNDAKLLRLGYCEDLAELAKSLNIAVKGLTLFECGTCMEKFIDPGMRDGHVKTHHRRGHDLSMSPGKMSPTGEVAAFLDTTGDREERRLQEEAPLYLDKTKAARGVK